MDKMEINEQQLNRIKELMSFKPMNESTQKNFGSEIVEYQKMAGDNKTYAIVREGKKYFIKVSDKASNILKEDFDFIGGFCNKSRYEYSSFNKALRNLELKVRSINEGVDKKDAKFEIHDADRTIKFLSEDKAQMSKEIKRQKQLMMHAIGMVNESVEPTKNDAFTNPQETIVDTKVEEVKEKNIVDEPKKGKTYKVTEEQLKQVKESYGQLDYDLMAGDDDDFGVKGWGKGVTEDAEENVEISSEDNVGVEDVEIDFDADGVCDNGDCFVQFSEDGDTARVKVGEEVSEWLPIEFVEDENGEMILSIEPEGKNIKVNEIIPVEVFEKFYPENEEVKESYGQLDYDLMAGDDDDFGVKGWGKGVTEDKEEEFEIEEDDLVEMITNILKKKL